MENERNVSRGESQSVAQVDNPRGEPKLCNHLMLYHVRPPSMEARTLAIMHGGRAVRAASDTNGGTAGRRCAAGLRCQHSHGE
eukprot:1123671-Pleurochrysis_carterae.AAC.1